MDPLEIPHFHNEIGAALIKISATEFMCIGALPPFDHPHVFLNMGEHKEAICPYCATHFAFDPTLGAGCDPPECAYLLEREVDLSAPEPIALEEQATASDSQIPTIRKGAPVVVDLSPQGRGLLASFASEEALSTAMRELGDDHYALQSFTPTIPEDDRGKSFLPRAILIGALVGAFGGFAVQSYANILGYPLDIGGRPEFSWPSFTPIAFEIGVLFAVLTGIVGYVFAGGLFTLFDPIDEHEAMRRVMRDAWVLAARSQDLSQRKRALEILRLQGAQDIEEIGA